MTDVAGISQGRVKLRAGTLYAALDRLLGDGIVSVDREEAVDGRLRRCYRLTPPGAELLAAEAARLSASDLPPRPAGQVAVRAVAATWRSRRRDPTARRLS